MTIVDTAPAARGRPSSCALLLSMSYADPEVRPLLDLEGLKVVGAGPHQRLRPAGRAPSTRSGFYDAERRRSPPRSTGRDARRPARPGWLGFERGAHLLVERALRGLPPGGRLHGHRRAIPPSACTCAPGAARRGHGFAVDADGGRLVELGRGAAEPSGGPAPSAPAGRGPDGIVAPPAGPLGAGRPRRAGRGRRARRRPVRPRRPRRRLGRPRAPALRARRRRAVGPGHRGRLGRGRRRCPPTSRRPSCR